MAKYLINDSTLQGIADAIREKRGYTYPLPVSGFATEIANISTFFGKPWIYDDADNRWYDNSEGLYSPDYDMTCPKCGARLQAGLYIDWSPVDTNCPICNLPITLSAGSVIERDGGASSSGTYFFDEVDYMWWENSDGMWSPDYYMSCPYCDGSLQATYGIDENPIDTECPHCGGAITLLDGSAMTR